MRPHKQFMWRGRHVSSTPTVPAVLRKRNRCHRVCIARARAGLSHKTDHLDRAIPAGYTIDIGQWDTHVGGIIYSPNYNLQTDFAPIGLMTINPQLMVARK